jgi:rhodanese-related sulfurtransferase
MCSWSSTTTGSWDNNVKNSYVADFTSDDTGKGEAGELPPLNTGLTTGQEILDSRLTAVAAEGFGEAAIGAGDVFAALNNYYIVNYWPTDHYANPGHIPGAMQYTPKQSIALAADLKTLPTDKTVVVYCYTGQTSANLAAYLRVLGYDAKSLKFGVNGMIYDNVPKAKWGDGEKHDYELVTD